VGDNVVKAWPDRNSSSLIRAVILNVVRQACKARRRTSRTIDSAVCLA
jgi:hypothetical protein